MFLWGFVFFSIPALSSDRRISIWIFLFASLFFCKLRSVAGALWWTLHLHYFTLHLPEASVTLQCGPAEAGPSAGTEGAALWGSLWSPGAELVPLLQEGVDLLVTGHVTALSFRRSSECHVCRICAAIQELLSRRVGPLQPRAGRQGLLLSVGCWVYRVGLLSSEAAGGGSCHLAAGLTRSALLWHVLSEQRRPPASPTIHSGPRCRPGLEKGRRRRCCPSAANCSQAFCRTLLGKGDLWCSAAAQDAWSSSFSPGSTSR